MKIFRDIQNWFFIRKTILKNKDSSEWLQYNIKYDWLYRMAIVINMRPEDFGEPKEVHQTKMIEFQKPVLTYLGEKLGLGELLHVDRYRIANTNSYLLKITHNYNVLSIKYVLIRVLILAAIITGIVLL